MEHGFILKSSSLSGSILEFLILFFIHAMFMASVFRSENEISWIDF